MKKYLFFSFELIKKKLSFLNRDEKRKIIYVSLATLFFLGLLFFIDGMAVRELDRPASGEDEKTINLNIKNKESSTVQEITLNPRILTDGEYDLALKQAEKEVGEIVLNGNESFDNIRTDLKFPSSDSDGIFAIDWTCDDYDLIDCDGLVHNENFMVGEEKSLNINAVFSYQGRINLINYEVKVKARNLGNDERLISNFRKEFEKTDRQTAYDEKILLPENLDGKQVVYSKPREIERYIIVLLMGVSICIFIPYSRFAKIKAKSDKEKKELENEYYEMVMKLTLLMGAGMTFRKAWDKISNQYKKGLEIGQGKKSLLLDYMVEANNGMKSGMSESEVLQDFADSCKSRRYSKFCSTLIQGMKKGSCELILILKNEAAQAMRDRENMAIKLGSVADTKMIIPMMIMLLVVMVIVMIPAVMSF